MPANLNDPFGPSCCDGGACSTNSKSALSCGCDEGAHWVCERHRMEGVAGWMPKQNEYRDPLEKHLKEVVNKTWNYAGRLKDAKDHTLNAVMGLAGEAGEILDEHKKLFFHKSKDRTQEIKLELGDLCYYLAKVIDLYDFTLDEVLQANREKLFERHGIE